jgi:hypothetical protein
MHRSALERLFKKKSRRNLKNFQFSPSNLEKMALTQKRTNAQIRMNILARKNNNKTNKNKHGSRSSKRPSKSRRSPFINSFEIRPPRTPANVVGTKI